MARVSPKLIAVLLLFWLLLTLNFNGSWFMYQDNWQIWVPASVRNYDLYPRETIGWLVTWSPAPVPATELRFYTNHPPLIAWLPYATTHLFGFNELAVRYPFVVVMWLSGVVLYVLARRLYGEKVAFWSLTVYSLVPMVNYFGRVLGHDQIGMLFSLTFACVMVNWLKQPTRYRFLAMLGCAMVSAWSAWTAVFAVGGIGLAGFLLGKRIHKWQMVVIGVLTAASVGSVLVFYQAQWSGAIESLLNAYSWRSSDATLRPESVSFTLVEWLFQNAMHILFFGTGGFSLLALVGLIPLKRLGWRKNGVLLGVFMGALAYLVLFRNATYIHHYYKLLLFPSMAISAGLAYVTFRRRHPRRQRLLWDACLASIPIWAVIIYVTMHATADTGILGAVTTTINREVALSQSVAVWLDYASEGEGSPNQGVMEYYTNRTIAWALPPTQIEKVDVYIYCGDAITDIETQLGIVPLLIADYPCAVFRKVQG